MCTLPVIAAVPLLTLLFPLRRVYMLGRKVASSVPRPAPFIALPDQRTLATAGANPGQRRRVVFS